MILCLSKTSEDLNHIKEVVSSVSNKGLLNDIVIVVSENIFEEKNLNKYLEYKARAIVADKHKYPEDKVLYNKHADNYIDKWVRDIKSGIITYYLNGKIGRSELSTFTKNILNNTLSQQIFCCGIENINETKNNENLWKNQVAVSQAEKYVTSRTLTDLISNLSGVDKKSLAILKDNNEQWIVDENLKLNNVASDKHPIKLLDSFVNKQFTIAREKGKFNMGIVLNPLAEAPYGLYPNKLNVAAFSFVLRKYVNQLYDARGYSIDETKMKNLVINTFKFWANGKNEDKLIIRFGSETEKKLIDLIDGIFSLNLTPEDKSIENVRWKLRDWIKSKKAPLWLFKYSSDNNKALTKSIDALYEFLRPKDNNIPESIIQNCFEALHFTKLDFKLLIQKETPDLFRNFLKGLDEDLSDEQIPKIITHLINVMPEETDNWDEGKVENEVLRWIIKDSEPKSPIINEDVESQTDDEDGEIQPGDEIEDAPNIPYCGEDEDDEDTGTVIDIFHDDEDGDIIEYKPSKNVITKIKESNPEVIKKVTIQILEHNEEFQKIFAEYLERVE